MTQAEAIHTLPAPEAVKAVLYHGGSSHQRRKERRAYVREFAQLWVSVGAAAVKA